MTFSRPHAATQEEIDGVIEAFAHAAEFCHKCGFDGVELHGAHGYLLSQFLSPSTNMRTDKYGGSLANRARLIMEIARAVQDRVPASFILGIKINSVEFQDKGFNAEECRDLCRELEASRFDFVELSGGTYEHLAFAHQRESTMKREAFFLDFAEVIAPALKQTKVYCTGGFKTANAMVKALGSIDGVGMARAVAQEPHLPRDLLAGKVKAAIEPRLDQQNFGLCNIAAGTQIRQVGKDEEPMDLSSEQVQELFFKDMEAWSKAMAQDKDHAMYGYVDLHSPATPYGGTA